MWTVKVVIILFLLWVIGKNITKMLGLDSNASDRYQTHNFITSWKFHQKPWFRDSKEASIHLSWFERIFRQYSKTWTRGFRLHQFSNFYRVVFLRENNFSLLGYGFHSKIRYDFINKNKMK